MIRGPEPQPYSSRTKLGLETPLSVRIWREKKLIVAPPLWYDQLTWACIIYGVVECLGGLINFVFPLEFLFPLGEVFAFITGPLVLVAGLWGQLSSERLVCDLKARTYGRREGQGLFKRVTHGRFDDIDAVVLTCGTVLTAGGMGVQYRLVMHWKQGREPLLIIEQEAHPMAPGQPWNFAAGRLHQRGTMVSQWLGIKFYDNSHFQSGDPLRPF